MTATSFFALPGHGILPTRASTLKCFQDIRISQPAQTSCSCTHDTRTTPKFPCIPPGPCSGSLYNNCSFIRIRINFRLFKFTDPKVSEIRDSHHGSVETHTFHLRYDDHGSVRFWMCCRSVPLADPCPHTSDPYACATDPSCTDGSQTPRIPEVVLLEISATPPRNRDCLGSGK